MSNEHPFLTEMERRQKESLKATGKGWIENLPDALFVQLLVSAMDEGIFISDTFADVMPGDPGGDSETAE